MIYDKSYMAEGNPKGKTNEGLFINQLSWLLVKRRPEVVEAFKNAGYEVDGEATPKKLKEMLRKAVVALKQSTSPKQVRKESRLIRNISVLIVANKQAKNKRTQFIKGLFKGGDSDFLNLTDEERKEYEDARAEYEASQRDDKKGGWFKENQDTIISTGNKILKSLFGNKNNDRVDRQIETYQKQPEPTKSSNTGLIIGVGIGAIAIIGLTVFLVRKKKK